MPDVLSEMGLAAADERWLQTLVADWQILADLSFADLVLWVPDPARSRWRAVAQVRPATGPTTLLHDIFGTHTTEDPRAITTHGARCIPVARAGTVIGVLVRQRAGTELRHSGDLENAYLDTAEALAEMIEGGDFPVPGASVEVRESLRVGDGFIRLGPDGAVRFASPNALSAYRRLGLTRDLAGAQFGEATAALLDEAASERALRTALSGRDAVEVEFGNASGTLVVRVIPLRRRGVADGAAVLLRDVTELRVRERALVSKEATIREIHHRVKNNLQTVAALLRLQGRRAVAPEARAALEEAERRVGSIALVHETLSRSFDEAVDFDDIADRLLRTVLEVSAPRARGERIGSFGSIPGTVATPLAMVLTELVQNAAQHAWPESSGGAAPGRLTLAVNRIRDKLRMRVTDDGVGLPACNTPTGSLGLSIVTTLVESELGGTAVFEARPGGGTSVLIDLSVA